MRLLSSIILIVSINIAGCAGTWVSGRPIYPNGWPAIDMSRECTNLSGRYRVVSDEAGPLVYGPGGHPREMFFFVTYGNPEPVPPLGRRLLSWHLAGVFSRDHTEWNDLVAYAAAIEAESSHADPKDGAGWVEVQEMSKNTMEIRIGLHDKTRLNYVLRKEDQGVWTYQSHLYECQQGGITVIGAFPPPQEENPTGRKGAAIGAKFTFFRATDGSLIALEEAYTGVAQGTMLFNKWWRWRQIKP